jgi:heme/copper-type cytochrome/quinol oxidase subunit 2
MRTQPTLKTNFGLAALISGILCVLSLLSNYTAANLNISVDTFNLLNNLTALFYCVLTPLAFVLGAIGYTRKNDSKNFSAIAIALVVIPFLIIFAQLIYSFVK